jgi:hypothetical protein
MTRKAYNLIEANVSYARADLDDPIMKGFVDRLDVIDELAHGWPGFVSQPALPDEGQVYAGLTLLNVSVWESIEHLRAFTYSSKHAELLDQRSDWFLQSEQPAYVLFWFPAGELPTEEEIRQRFDHLRANGPTPQAFTFDRSYTVEEMLEYEGEVA